MRRLIIFFISLSAIVNTACVTTINYKNGKDYRKPHKCIYKLCPYKGDTHFSHGCGACEAGSDCYKLDSLHFRYPRKDYDYLDSVLISNQ